MEAHGMEASSRGAGRDSSPTRRGVVGIRIFLYSVSRGFSPLVPLAAEAAGGAPGEEDEAEGRAEVLGALDGAGVALAEFQPDFSVRHLRLRRGDRQGRHRYGFALIAAPERLLHCGDFAIRCLHRGRDFARAIGLRLLFQPLFVPITPAPRGGGRDEEEEEKAVKRHEGCNAARKYRDGKLARKGTEKWSDTEEGRALRT